MSNSAQNSRKRKQKITIRREPETEEVPSKIIRLYELNAKDFDGKMRRRIQKAKNSKSYRTKKELTAKRVLILETRIKFLEDELKRCITKIDELKEFIKQNLTQTTSAPPLEALSSESMPENDELCDIVEPDEEEVSLELTEENGTRMNVDQILSLSPLESLDLDVDIYVIGDHSGSSENDDDASSVGSADTVDYWIENFGDFLFQSTDPSQITHPMEPREENQNMGENDSFTLFQDSEPIYKES